MNNLPPTDDLRIVKHTQITAPVEIHQEFPITEVAAQTTANARQTIRDILLGNDQRLLVIVGPCSIHDPEAAWEYAQKLKQLANELQDSLFIVMRIYFEKPRSTVGWKGLINDPDLDSTTFDINKGLRLARKLLIKVSDHGVPAATEYLDLMTPQYISDLIAWGAIGARTTESQGHREMSSGLSCPVGFKNGTEGNLQIAVDALLSASRPHIFMSHTKQGHTASFQTSGNPDCHLILRGGKDGPNYDAQSVANCCELLAQHDLPQKLMVDFSHANSAKDHNKQVDVAHNVAQQIEQGTHKIMGIMIESNLHAGKQKVVPGQPLEYGVSITDACIDWDTTATLLRDVLAPAVTERNKDCLK